MSIKMDWRWWTYFKLESELVSAANVEEYDIKTKRIKFRREWNIEAGEIPDSIETTFLEIWGNPKRTITLSARDTDLLQSGLKPDSFIKLVDQDPEEFFGKPKLLSNYFPPALKRQVADLESNELRDSNPT